MSTPTKCNEKVKMKYVIKTFLCANKGKKYTSRQLCNFIVKNKLNSKNSYINPSAVTRLISSDTYLLRDVMMEKDKDSHKMIYWIMGDADVVE